LTGLARNDISRRMIISLKKTWQYLYFMMISKPLKGSNNNFLIKGNCSAMQTCKKYWINIGKPLSPETEFLFSTRISSARKSRWSEVNSLMQKQSLSEHPISEKNQCDRPRELGNIPRNTFRFTFYPWLSSTFQLNYKVINSNLG